MNRFTTKALIALVLCALLVCLSYFFWDKPLAFWVAAHPFWQYPLFSYLSEIALLVYAGAFILLVVLGIKALIHPLVGGQRRLFILALAIVVTSYIKDMLKVVFGRTWPGTWTCDNPSLIRDDIYGFNWFHSGAAYQSFPSGHTTVLFCAMAFLWVLAPKWRPLAILLCLLQVVGLLAMDYHFLGDVIAGAFLGGLCGSAALKIISCQQKGKIVKFPAKN